MKYLLPILFLLAACSADKTVLPDHKDQIDNNTARILLLEANDALQDLRLDKLEVQVSDLEGRMQQAEDDIDANEVKIAQLCNDVNILQSDLLDLRDDLNDAVAELEQADRQTRRMLRRKVRRLRRQLAREIRIRRLADQNLQNQIDDLEGDLGSFYAQQQVINSILFGGLVMTNIRITQLQNQIQNQLNNIGNTLNNLQSQINSINTEISNMQSQMTAMQAQLDDVESRLVSVVYPCGEGNGEEVLLQTQDGLVAYFQQMENKTLNFSDSITVAEHIIPAHTDKYCKDRRPVGWLGDQRCREYGYRHVGSHIIPAQTYSVGDTATVKVLKKAYLDVLVDGTYSTTDGYSCTFTVSNGEVL